MKTDTVLVNQIEMDYFSFGSGEKAFVILPGLDTKSVLLSAKAIQAAYRVFERDYTVYVFDPRKNMPCDYSIRQLGDDTAQVMEALGIRDACLFGASKGGMVAMCIAIDHPKLVKKLVLGSTTAKADERVISGMDRWIDLAQKKDMVGLTADFIDHLYSKDTIGKYKDILIHMNDNVSDQDIERFIIQAKALKAFDVYDELQKIRCQTLVIGTKGDKVLPWECSDAIANKLGCELYLYGEEYGHCVFDEAPDYKRRLLDFYAKP